jgi:hypothetical protein
MAKDPREEPSNLTPDPAQNPDLLRQFFDRVESLLSLAHAKKDQPIKDLPEGIEEKLRQIGREIELLCNTNEKIFENAETPPEKLAISDKDTRLLNYVENLKKEAAALQREFTIKANTAKQREKTQGKTGEKERKKKFNQMGGRKDWKPL